VTSQECDRLPNGMQPYGKRIHPPLRSTPARYSHYSRLLDCTPAGRSAGSDPVCGKWAEALRSLSDGLFRNFYLRDRSPLNLPKSLVTTKKGGKFRSKTDRRSPPSGLAAVEE
jgi:hypothetical protein